ncbi:unnamed protein product [Pleuronectes platessa]|uniref:Uncharacterized protein n=1 Tax=Pleuronectes platessa TaxID=8262 RepID=A0A9N7UB33_PLEPL|nr:unnamed protein product [Pleuronectes platessa]
MNHGSAAGNSPHVQLKSECLIKSTLNQGLLFPTSSPPPPLLLLLLLLLPPSPSSSFCIVFKTDARGTPGHDSPYDVPGRLQHLKLVATQRLALPLSNRSNCQDAF